MNMNIHTNFTLFVANACIDYFIVDIDKTSKYVRVQKCKVRCQSLFTSVSSQRDFVLGGTNALFLNVFFRLSLTVTAFEGFWLFLCYKHDNKWLHLFFIAYKNAIFTQMLQKITQIYLNKRFNFIYLNKT